MSDNDKYVVRLRKYRKMYERSRTAEKKALCEGLIDELRAFIIRHQGIAVFNELYEQSLVKKWGGRQIGAGRPKLEGSRHSYTVPDDVHNYIMDNGGGCCIAGLVRREMKGGGH